MIFSNGVFGSGSLHFYGNVFISQSWVCFVLITHPQPISGIYTDCSKFDRQDLRIRVLLSQISGTSMNLYLLTFKLPVSGKSEVKLIYKRLYFFWKKKIFLNLRMLALLQGLLIKLCQKANYRQLAVEFWTPAFLRNRKGIQYLNKKCTMTFCSHIGKIMYQIFHSCGDMNTSRCLCYCRSRRTEKQWLKATR